MRFQDIPQTGSSRIVSITFKGFSWYPTRHRRDSNSQPEGYKSDAVSIGTSRLIKDLSKYQNMYRNSWTNLKLIYNHIIISNIHVIWHFQLCHAIHEVEVKVFLWHNVFYISIITLKVMLTIRLLPVWGVSWNLQNIYFLKENNSFRMYFWSLLLFYVTYMYFLCVQRDHSLFVGNWIKKWHIS